MTTQRGDRILVLADKVLVAVFYLSYGLLLILEASRICFEVSHGAAGLSDALRAALFYLVAPLFGFLLLSLVRAKLNAPRPYEVHPDAKRILAKDTRGKSFPSRHAFCAFLISTLWLCALPPVGCVLTLLALGVACIRVVGGIHFPRDVVAGSLAGMLWALMCHAILF